MVRNYRRKNKYCQYTKLTEEQFERLFDCWYECTSARHAAETVGVDYETARRLFQRLRRRLMEDEYLAGFMGGGKNIVPPAKDKAWDDIYHCLFDCPAYAPLTREHRIGDESSLKNAGLQDRLVHVPRLYVRGNLVAHKNVDCRACPLGGVQFAPQFLRNAGIAVGVNGRLPRKNFREWFFYLNFVTNIHHGRCKYKNLPTITKQTYLEHFEAHPL